MVADIERLPFANYLHPPLESNDDCFVNVFIMVSSQKVIFKFSKSIVV